MNGAPPLARATGLQTMLAGFERINEVAQERWRQERVLAESLKRVEQERADRIQSLLDGFADRLMVEYREVGEPPYQRLANTMDVSKATVCRILNGKGKTLPRWWQVEALMTACGVDAGTINEIKRDWIGIRNELKPIYRDDTVEQFD